MKAKVRVTLKKGILDPQGKAVLRSLQQLGYTGLKEVRIGKFIEIEMDPKSGEDPRKRVAGMCEKLLANTVIEDFQFEVEG